MSLRKTGRWSGLALLFTALFAVWQFAAEIIQTFEGMARSLMQTAWIASLVQLLSRASGLKLTNPHWMAYGLHRLMMLAVCIAIFYLYFQDKKLARLALMLSLTAIAFSLLLNLLGSLLHINALDVVASHSFEYLFSPLLVFALIPLLKLSAQLQDNP